MAKNLYNGKASEVFFEEGAWEVVAPEFGWGDKGSAIAHKCGWFGKRKISLPGKTRKQTHPLCMSCNEEVPPALVGLWKMHNWDLLQELEAKDALYERLSQWNPSFYQSPLHGTSSGGAR
jgi:hypothetical protein